MNESEMDAFYGAPEPAASGEPSPEAKAAAAVSAYFEKNADGIKPEPKAAPTAEQIVREQIAEKSAPAEKPAALPESTTGSYRLEAPEGVPTELINDENAAILASFSDAVSNAGVPRAEAELM